ncbi:unnamed protein product [Haemonchus placei]|uniref:Protein kinase domain-containing protein n=1 Tax=Haemonchus placei TaxID=6290 RepID=A0A0N4X4V3_HAEPC|nr:unnamed protein product [Haemonchus placei]
MIRKQFKKNSAVGEVHFFKSTRCCSAIYVRFCWETDCLTTCTVIIVSLPDAGPVQLPKGKIVGQRWRIIKKLGEGGCGSVYKVQDIKNHNAEAALKAESNFVAGGTVLKLEVEGGCGSVYKVQDIKNHNAEAALKAESNFVAGGTVLKLEVQILNRLKGRPHVPQLIHSGKKEMYCYMVMTLLGDTLSTLQR